MATKVNIDAIQSDMRTVCNGYTEATTALKAIAEHFEGCDISGDTSARWIVNRACRVLGWSTDIDSSGQLKLIKPLGTSW